jgi:bifunctional non-homologous end joining protein LigD
MTRSRGAETTALPGGIKPQVTKLVAAPPEGPEWLHEIKFDGYRMHARLDRGAVRLLTRTGLDWTHKYPGIAAAVSTLPALRRLQLVLKEGRVVSDKRYLSGAVPQPDEARF